MATQRAGSTACCPSRFELNWCRVVRSMDSADRSILLCRAPQRASMGKKSMLRSPAVCVPDRLRSNQEESSEEDDQGRNCNVSTTHRRAMQHSVSYDNGRHEAAASAATGLSRSKSVVVLRRCEDLNVRTGGFQKIEEAAHRLDIRRQRQQHAQHQQSPENLLAGEAVLRTPKLT